MKTESKPLTLQEAKDKIAKWRGFNSYRDAEDCGFGLSTADILRYVDEAAELYMQSHTKALRKEIEEKDEIIGVLKRAMIKGDSLYSTLLFDDDELSPYQKALRELEALRKEKEQFLVFVEWVANKFGGDYPGSSVGILGCKAKELLNQQPK